MARGWESKSVSDQIESRGAVARGDDSNDPTLPREARERLEALRLSRARTLEQLARATHAAHRRMLERTLSALDAEEEALRRQAP